MVRPDCVWFGYHDDGGGGGCSPSARPFWNFFLFDVAALNTTHHFNYLFDHKTVETKGGASGMGALGASGQLSAQFSLAGGWKSLNLTNCQRFLSHSKPTADENPTQTKPNSFLSCSALPIDCFPYTHSCFSELANLFMTDGRQIQYF